MVIDVDRHARRRGRERQSGCGAAVERVDAERGARVSAQQAPPAEQQVLERQALVRSDVQRRGDAQLAEQVEHAGRSAERVGIRLVVHGERHLGLAAHRAADGVQVGGGGPHSASSSPSTWISGCTTPRTSSSRLRSLSMCSALSSVSS